MKFNQMMWDISKCINDYILRLGFSFVEIKFILSVFSLIGLCLII